MSLTVILMLTGCASDSGETVANTSGNTPAQPAAQVPISLQGYTSKPQAATRGDSTLLAYRGIPDGKSIGVFAYYHQGTDSNSDGVIDTNGKWTGTEAPNFMFNQQATCSTRDDAFMYSPLKYWPNTPHDKLSFIGYYPYTTTIGGDEAGDHGIKLTKDRNDAGLPAFELTVADDVAKQVDFLVSDLLTGLPNGTSAVSPSSAEGRSTLTVTDKVRLMFRHATSKVTIRVVIADSLRQDFKSLKINKLELTNIWSKGTLALGFTPETGTTLDVTGVPSDSLTYTVVKADPDPEKAINHIKDCCLMLPQTLALVYDEEDPEEDLEKKKLNLAETAKITISYSIELRSHGTVYIYDEVTGKPKETDHYTYSNTGMLPLAKLTRKGSGTKIGAWEPNHHYVYTIRLGAKRIEFTGQVVEWGAEDTWEGDVKDI